MKTVQDYLDLGLVFVDGDKGYKHIIESFAWRNNSGVKPEYKGLVEVVLNDGTLMLHKEPEELHWPKKLDGFSYTRSIAKWRPVVLKSESPTVSLKEDKPMKPVYTAEMHTKGELPTVGAECILIVNDEPRLAKVTYIGKNIVCCSNVDGDAEYACLLGLVSFKPIPKTIKVNGFDVPAPMSEAPEVGSVCFVASINNPVFFYSIYWETISCNKTALSRGLVHSNKSAAIAHAKAMLGIDPNA